MPKENVYLMVEPVAAVPVWFARAIAGLKESCNRRRLTLTHMHSFTAFDELNEVPTSAIIITSQNDWTYHAVQELKRRGIAPILVGVMPEHFGEKVSGIKLARRIFIEKVMDYFVACQRTRMALVGVNHNASNDNVKANVFLQNAVQMRLTSNADDIYWIDSDISSSVQKFLINAAKYDSVICSNDYVAVVLLAHAKEHGIYIPDELYVAGLGNTVLGRYTSPTLTTTSEDEFCEMGRQALFIAQSLCENPFLANIIITVDTKIVVRGSTNFIQPQEISFCNKTALEPIVSIGPESQAVRNLENCLRSCDSLDLQILQDILAGKSNSQIEEELFLAHSSLYYRLRRLYQTANVSSQLELKHILRFYLPNFDSPTHT